ncbi:lipopolysaccharide biosynthesis protein [Myceligenerans pegani]|uniref:Lipopolysaccharide biosynthesis protein n=1 Tax=Myceligenerans pegani TaxID=2776917 RepID=A0ABR9MV19_9MICO|nr:lipopolysaccharide biosynthesis protein [Myceligenerans sp. TRM 65318]MBE1875232.1 lipopolysaccharide biosynthesis protein [Myceligenerans sp. TRM 65318]MBE3017503.1 lipopolysaccharide biosynthesis protein [Myceligenerans sp. TRM 65318]
MTNPTASLARTGARGGVVTLAGQAATVLTRTVVLILLARLIAPEAFGLVAIVTAIATFATAVMLFGIPMAVVQAEHVSARAKSTLFLVNVGLGVLFAAVISLASGPLARLYDDERLAAVAGWIALVPLVNGLMIQSRTHLMRNLRFTRLFVAETAGLLIGVGVAVLLAVQGADIEAVVALQVAPVAVQAVLVMVAARWLPGRPGELRETGALLRVGMRILGMNVLKSGARNVVVPVMGLTVPAAAVGAFDRAQHLIVAPINLTVDQMQRVAVPVLSRLRGEPGRMLAYMQRAQLLGTYGTATLFLVVAALGEPIVRILLGPDWDTAGTVIQILAAGATCRALAQTMQWVFISADATTQGLRFNLWSQPLVAALSLAGLPWGVLGVATANSVAWALLWPTATLVAARSAGFPAGSLFRGPARALALFGLPVMLAAALPRLLDLDDWSTVLLGAGAAVCAGLLSRWAFRAVRADLGALAATARLALSRRQPARTGPI